MRWRRIAERSSYQRKLERQEQKHHEALSNAHFDKLATAIDRLTKEQHAIVDQQVIAERHALATRQEIGAQLVAAWRKKRDWYDYANLGVVIAAFLAAAAAAYEAYRLAEVTDKLALDAKTAADTAHLDNTTALFSQTRPWLAFVLALDPLRVGSPIRVGVQWVNAGHSPAFKARVFAGMQGITKNQTPPEPLTIMPDATPPKMRSIGVILPGPSGIQWLEYEGKPPLTQQTIDALATGQISLWITGRAEYFDGNDKPHFTMFRGVYESSSGGFVFTDRGNDAN